MKKDNRIILPEAIAEIVVDDILESSDEEVLEMAQQRYGDVNSEIIKTQELILVAVIKSKKSKLVLAKKQLRENQENSSKNNVLSLPIEAKRKLIEEAKISNKSLTLAARNEEEMSVSDTDNILQDLIDLGVIDEDGHLK